MGFVAENISFYYGDRCVIDRLSISLEPGKFYGVMGPNGCGKTTLLDLLMGHRKPASGAVTYKGKKLSAYSRKALSREIALTPQNFYINFPFRAKEVVMMGRYPHISRFSTPSVEDIRIVLDIMKQTGTYRFRNQYITELSGGERQRVVFARALAQDAPVLILDEATSNLDINHSISLLNIAARGVDEHGRTVIAVFQDVNLAALYCHELIFMTAGVVAAQGPCDSVLTPGILKTVFRADARVAMDHHAGALQVSFSRRAHG